jgi:ABC-type lipoprotein export system ATPase subunit
MSAQFIFTMYKVGRVVPPEREVLKDISLSFYPGAKIGVIGPNGSGKSTLLRIMAGIDDGYTGEARLSPGFTVGMLEQEPKLDESKDVTGNVMDGVAETAKLLTDYDELMAGWADPDADYEALGAQQADLEAKIEAAGAWDLKRTVEIAMDALRLPPGDADVASLSGGEARRVALCRLLLKRPDLLLLDEPTNHLDAESVAWIERFLADYEGHRRGDHPRPVLPRQRRQLDPRAGPRQGHALRRQLLRMARTEAGPAGQGGKARLHPPAHPGARAGVGAHGAQGPPGQEQGPPGPRTTNCSPSSRPPGAQAMVWRSTSRRAIAWAIRSSRWITSPRASATNC